jgi:hypothetical protein
MKTDYGYLQARVQARFALLPDESLWLHFAALRELASFLEELRNTSLSGWVTGLSASSSAADIETHLRKNLVDLIQEIAGWFNQSWSVAVNALQTFLELPKIESSVRSESFDIEDIHDPVLVNLLKSVSDSDDLLNAWLSGWRSQWPEMPGKHRQGIESLIDILTLHRRQFLKEPAQAAWESRHALEGQVRYFFRRHGLQPVAAFSYLVLAALVMERLRAELLQRALFTEQFSVPEGDV